MKTARIVPLCVAAVASACAAGVAQAQDVSWRTQVGAPDVTVVEGRAIAWRNVQMRAAAGAVSVQATLPACSEGPHAVSTLFDRAGTGCRAANGATVAAPVGPELEAKLHLPRLLDAAPDASVALRRWGKSRPWRNDGGAEVDLELSKGAGPVLFYAGQATPVAIAYAGDAWRAIYAGVKIKPARGHVVELEIEREAALRSGRRSADAGLQYAFTGLSATRAKAYLTVTDTRAWRGGVGLDWYF